jgi:DNA-binding FadR family transcriptional regulator
VVLIRSGDGDAAEAAWREHMANVRRYVGRTQVDGQVLDVLY